MRQRGASDRQDLTAAGAGALTIAAAVALGVPLLGASAVALLVACAALAAVGPRPLPILVPAAWGAVLVIIARPAGDVGDTILGAAIATGLMAVALELRLGRAVGDSSRPDLATSAIAIVGGVLTASCFAAGHAAAFVATVAVAVLHVAARRPERSPALLLVVSVTSGVVAAGVLGDVERTGLDESFGLGLVALAFAAGVTWWRARSRLDRTRRRRTSPCAAVPFGLAAVGASAGEIAAALMILAVVLTGWAFVSIPLTPIGTAGLTASGLAVAIAVDGSRPLLVSVACLILGLQATLHGLTARLAGPGARWHRRVLAAAASTWFTSGANDAVVTWLRPYGVTGSDLAVAATAVVLLAGGALASRLGPWSSWFTIGPGLGLATGWLLAAEVGRDVGWSLPLTLATGVLAVGAGGWRRLAAPLVLGTATIATAVVVTAGPRLAELDSWVWLACGGAALIALAVVVERSVGGDDAGPVDWRRLRETWR